MRKRDKTIILAAIDKAIGADKLNEFIIDLIGWHQEHSELSAKDICDDVLEKLKINKVK